MEDKKYIEFVLEDGSIEKCEILFTFKAKETNKHYVIFTDGKKNDEGVLNVTAAIYKIGSDNVIEEITDEEDKQIVSKFLEEGPFDARY